MARVKIDLVIIALASGVGQTATVEVRSRADNSLSTLHDAETAGGTVGNPVTATNGRLEAWVDEGRYNLNVTSPTSAFAPYTQAHDAVAATTHVSRREKTFSVPGQIAVASGQTDAIPGYFHSDSSNQTTKIVKVRAKLGTGTATIKVQRNGADLNLNSASPTMSLTSTGANFTPTSSPTLAEDDYVQPIVTVVGTGGNVPSNLSLTIIEEVTVS